MPRILALLLALLALQSAPVRAQDSRLTLQDDGVTQGASRILNCTAGVACTVANGIGEISAGGASGGAGGALDRSSPNVTVTNTVTETTLYTYALAGNALGTDFCITQRTVGTITGNNAGVLTLRAKYGAGVATIAVTPAAITGEALVIETKLCGDGTTNAQLLDYHIYLGTSGVIRQGQAALTVDSTASANYLLTAQWGTADPGLSVSKLYATTEAGGTFSALLDPGANGIVKRTSFNTTTAATAGTDYVIPSGSISGNAATATALAANGANCAAGNAPLGVDALGGVELCFDVATQAELNAFVPATASALANNPTDCGANQFANAIVANGNLTCTSLADSDIPNNITIDSATVAGALASNPTDCAANQFANTIAANGNLTCAAIGDADVPNNITVTLAATATALAANGANCTAGNAPLGVDASGVTEGCFDVATQAELNTFQPATATALAANGTNATAGNAILGVDAAGNAEGQFDVITPAELNVFVPATATALAANGANCSAGNAPLGVDASGAVESCFAVQTLDSELTTLAGKTIVGTGTDVRLSTGVFATNDCVQVDASGNLSSSGAACGTGGGGGTVTNGDYGDITVSNAGLTWSVDSGAVSAPEIVFTPSGNIAATNVGTALAELDTEKQVGTATLTTLGGKTVVGNGTDVRLSTGAFTTNDCVKVDSSGNLVTNGAICGVTDTDKGDITVSASGATWVVDSGAISAPEIVYTPAGNIAATNVSTAIAELDAEKQPLDADLTTLAGKTLAGTGVNVRFSTGTFATNDCVKVDASGNFITQGGICGVTDADKGDITASASGVTWTIDNDAVTNAKLNNVPTATIKGRVVAGTGDVDDLTTAQATTLIDVFTTSLKGTAPASGGGTVNFLRADGTWATPPGGAGVTDGDKGDITVSASGATWLVDTGAISAPEIVFTPTGNIAAINVATALAELDTEKQVADADLTTLAGKTIVGTGTDVRLSTGAFAANECVKVDASGNFTSTGAACANPSSSGDFSTNTATSVDSELLLFSGTAGKTGKRATSTGVLKGTSGVLGVSTATDMSAPNSCLDAGSTDTYACTLSPAIASYGTGSHYWFKANTINTGIATINLNALGAKTIKKLGGAITTDLADGDIRAGQWVHLLYDGTNMQMLSQLGNIPGGITPIAAVDCNAVALATLQTCIQDGIPPIFYYCSLPAGCAAGEAVSLPAVDTDTVGALNLQQAYDAGKQIIGVNDLSNALVLCVDRSAPADGDCTDVEDQSMSFYCDVSSGCQMITKPDGDTNYRAPTGYDVNLMIGTTTYVKLNHTTNKLEYLNAGRPLKSVEVQAYEGGVCTYTEAVIVAGKPKVGYFICTKVDTDKFDFDWVMPLNWDGGTVVVRLNATNVNASPSGILQLDCYGQAVSDGETIADVATTNEQAVDISFTGSAQYKEENDDSPPITLAGSSPAGGDHVYMHCDVDATATTTTQIANIRINAHPKVFYTVTSTSE